MITLEILSLATFAVIVLLVTLKGWPVLLAAVVGWGLFHWYQTHRNGCRARPAPEGPTVDVPPAT